MMKQSSLWISIVSVFAWFFFKTAWHCCLCAMCQKLAMLVDTMHTGMHTHSGERTSACKTSCCDTIAHATNLTCYQANQVYTETFWLKTAKQKTGVVTLWFFCLVYLACVQVKYTHFFVQHKKPDVFDKICKQKQ